MTQKADILVPCAHPDRAVRARGACGSCYARALRQGVPPLPPPRGRLKHRGQPRRAELLRLQYGLSLDDFDELVRQQGGRCLICGHTPADGQVLRIDHDHETGAIRGLLCNTCNRALGMFGDDLDRVRAAVAYLEAAARRRLAEAG